MIPQFYSQAYTPKESKASVQTKLAHKYPYQYSSQQPKGRNILMHPTKKLGPTLDRRTLSRKLVQQPHLEDKETDSYDILKLEPRFADAKSIVLSITHTAIAVPTPAPAPPQTSIPAVLGFKTFYYESYLHLIQCAAHSRYSLFG